EDWVGSDTGGGEPETNVPPTRGLADHCGGSVGVDVSVVAADQPRGNAAGDGDNHATKPPADGNGDDSLADGKSQADSKRAEDRAGRTRVGGMEDLTAIGGDDDDAGPSTSSDA
ncbi:unnamed protein product, partial [Sphacelaria rigidula]